MLKVSEEMQKIVLCVDQCMIRSLLSQGGEKEHVSFCVAVPPPQSVLAQLWPLGESIHDRIDALYEVPHDGVQLPSGTQLVHAQTAKMI